MHKFKTAKIFKVKDIPTNLLKTYTIKSGEIIMLIVNSNGINQEHIELSKWLIEYGAIEGEEIFLYNE